MKHHRPRTVAGVLLLMTLAGCSAPPTKPSATAQPAAAPGTPDGTVAAAPASTETVVSKKIPSGYKRVKRDGREVYCRSVTTIGSRFAEEMCFTREQLEEIVQRTDSALSDMERGRKVCVGIEGCGLN